jgi:hypothetical protein
MAHPPIYYALLYPSVSAAVNRRGGKPARTHGLPLTASRAPVRNDFSSNRHRALSFCLSMIFSENR